MSAKIPPNQDPISIRVPDGEDVLATHPVGTMATEPSNDLEVLQRAFVALVDTLPAGQRLRVLNILRGRESEPGDWPYYVAHKPDDEE
jgi:hypothetical protein